VGVGWWSRGRRWEGRERRRGGVGGEGWRIRRWGRGEWGNKGGGGELGYHRGRWGSGENGGARLGLGVGVG